MENFIKKLTCFLIIISVLGFPLRAFGASLSDIKNRGYFKVATNAEFEPFEYRDGTKITGIDIEIAKYIAKALGVELKINNISFDALTIELNNQSCDFAIAAMSYSEDKSHGVDFSAPYYTAKQSVLVLNSSNISEKNDLHGKRIGVQIGTSGDLYCTENYPTSFITRYNQILDASVDLKNGQLDAIVVDDLPAHRLLFLLGNKGKIMDEPLFEESYRIVVPEGNYEILNFINSTLNEMEENGEIKKITDKYMIVTGNTDTGIFSQIYRNLIYKERYKIIFQGAATTLQITFLALILGLLIGVTISLIKSTHKNTFISKVLKFLANAYLAIIRGTPATVQLFVIYYVILSSTHLSKIAVATIAFGINSGAYVSEIIRSGILSVDPGQYEAGRCLGLNNKTTMTKIILPQAVKNVLPTLINEFIQLIKETSIAGFIGVTDLSRAGDIIRSSTYEPIIPLFSVATIYLGLVMISTWLLSFVERRMRSHDKS